MELYDGSILRVIEYVESRIDCELSLDELASEAAFSKFHFTRIFKAVTKETIYEYIRKRRLTEAAKDLIETSIPLLQIAITYGYASQEAFTRAFKNYTGMSPQSYRKKAVHLHNLYKSAISETLLQTKKQPVRHTASIIEKPDFFIGGISLRDDFFSNQMRSQLWNRFTDDLRKRSIDPLTIKSYGYESLDHDNMPYYLAAIEVDSLENLPAGWTGMRIPRHTYAVFHLDNVIENLPYAMEEIYKNRLQELNVKPNLDFSFEFYHAGFIANDGTHPLQYFVPIE
ncbi:UNVERIFIED_CONTAM: AraC family transcriptional regulator [Brevibacillus sp. OAP136]